MTMISPAEAMAYAHIDDLLRTARQQRAATAAGTTRHRGMPVRTAAAAVLRWLRHGQLGGMPTPCVDC